MARPVWLVILKFPTYLTTLKTMVELIQIKFKIFYLSNNKFEPILNFQIKSSFPNMSLNFLLIDLVRDTNNRIILILKKYILD